MMQNTSRILSLLALAVWTTGCALQEEKPFDALAAQHMYRSRAAENRTPGLGSLPRELDRTYLTRLDGNGTTRPAATQPTTAQTIGKAIRIPLRDLIHLAAVNSLDVKVAGYAPAIEEARVIESEARFDPVFFANVNFATQSLLSATPGQPQVTGRTDFQSTNAATGLRQTLPNGAQVELRYQASNVLRGPDTFGLNGGNFAAGEYESSLVFQVTQPLLQNFGTETNRARVVVQRNTQRVSMLDFRIALERQFAEIEELYWQLVQAERELAIQETLYSDTEGTTRLLQRRLGQDVTQVILGQANAALRSREAELIPLRTRLRTISNEIKRRVNDPELPVASEVVILAQDAPIEAPIRFDLDEQLESALQNRAELAQQQIRIDSATVVQRAARNNLLPQLNLVGSVGLKGAAGQFADAFGDMFGTEAQEYAIGLQFEVPLGNREARAIMVRTTLQRQQAIDQYRTLIEQVCLDVKNAHDQVYSNWQQLVARRQARFAAEQALQAIRTEENVGQQPLTPDFVNRKLQAQEILAQNARLEVAALSDYNTAIATLERAKGTILKYDNILMQEDPRVPTPVRLTGR